MTATRSPRGERQPHALGAQRERDAAADAAACPGDNRGSFGNSKIHSRDAV